MTTEVLIPEREMTKVIFIESSISGNEPARCIDGRPDYSSQLGPQLLGGDIHEIVLDAIYNNRDLDKETVERSATTLQAFGTKIGVHRDSHSSHEKSGCGFADNLQTIVKTAIEHRQLIKERLMQVYRENARKFENTTEKQLEDLLDGAFEIFATYDPSRIKITGTKLIDFMSSLGASTETVEGNHQEEVAFVNFKKDITLNTPEVNRQGHQAFSQDPFAASQRANKLGIPFDFSFPASLIMLDATARELVEKKGKPPVPVMVHA